MNMPEQPTLLLTGGTGFIGRHLAMPLARVFPDHRRLMVVRGSAAACDQLWRPTSLDLVDSRALEELVEWARPSIVVHLAAESAFGSAALTAESVWRLNFDATFALARAVARYAPECLVLFTSTAQVYGASFLGGPVTDDSAVRNGIPLGSEASPATLQTAYFDFNASTLKDQARSALTADAGILANVDGSKL